MDYANLRLDIRGGVARIILNRPDAGNALDLDTARELLDAAIHCSEDRAVRAVIVTGAGRMFCAGGDLKSFAARGDRLPAYLKEVTTSLHAALARFTRMDAPVIAAVNGPAAGGGMSLACAADLVLAAESARFTMAFTRIGLSPDSGSTWLLPRLVGFRRALELTLTNRTLTAQEALAWGLVTRVVPDADLAREAEALAAALAAGPTRAFGAAKRLFQLGAAGGFETQMEHETQALADMARTADCGEGIAAFLAKRAPVFAGQ